MTITEAAINVRASEIANAIWKDKARLAEFAGDVFRPMPNAVGPANKLHHATAMDLLGFLDADPHGVLWLCLRQAVHEAIESYARQRAYDEHEGLIQKPTNTPPLPDCTGCRVDLAGEVECCQEKP